MTGSIAFMAGILLLQQQAHLPSTTWLWLLPLLPFLFWRLPRLRLPVLLASGFLWALLQSQWLLRQQLPAELETRDLLVSGQVVSLPVARAGHSRFLFRVEQLLYQGRDWPPPGTVRLSWYRQAPALVPGERWRLRVRLKRPHGFMNPGGFDYEGWLFRNGIRATGYVRNGPGNQRIARSPPTFALQRLRQSIAQLIHRSNADPTAVALLEALVIGDRSALPPEAWARFRRTGTSHLIAISGLHVAIVAGLAALIGGWLWRRCEPCMLRLPAPLAGAFAALTAGFLYAALAGFSIPTQRALLMLTVALGAVFARREPQPARVLAAALTVVLVADSTAILSPGFWLSFAAVGVIAMSLWGRVGRPGALGGWAGVQWAVSIGLLPLLLLWQGEVPLLAPLVNLLLVPLFSLLLIPLALAGAITGLVFSPLGVPLLHLAGIGLERVQWLLAQVPDLPLRPLSPVTQLPPALWLSATAGVLLLLAPRGLPGRKAGILLLLPLLLQVPVRPAPGSIWLYLLDVGQGQSAVLRTRNHTLIYDTGPRFSAHFDAGSAVLVPFLKAQGVTRAERVILSNGDLDHMGGFHSLQQSLPVGVVMSGEPARVGISGVIPCRAGMAWQWDGVHFRILHPPSGADWRGNDASCVLQVEAGGVQLLLTGDIEAPAERALMASAPERLHSRLLLVPHHGSGSSSTSAFVAATAPEYALISAGYRNRYHFPKPSVVARWRRQGARVLNTASSGALLFRITPHAGILPPERYRCRSGRYWNDRPALCGE